MKIVIFAKKDWKYNVITAKKASLHFPLKGVTTNNEKVKNILTVRFVMKLIAIHNFLMKNIV